MFFVSEMMIYVATSQNYMFSIFFWLDLAGTSSMLLDIPWILKGIGLSQNLVVIAKGGKIGKLARGAAAGRLLKLFKMLAMFKLFRINHILKQTTRKAVYKEHKVGIQHFVNKETDAISKQVIFFF